MLSWLSGVAGWWAYLLVGGLAAAESAAFVGLIVPGETAMLIGGFLAQQGRVSLPVMLAAAILGAVVGDSLGYEIGRRVGPALRRSRLGARVGDPRWRRAEQYLTDKGGRAVFFGRWVGLLRALVPAVAGAARMPYRRFLFYNAAGGISWAAAFVLLGYGVGASYQQVAHVVGRAGLLLAIVVLVGAAAVVLARWVARHPAQVRAARAALARPATVRHARTGLDRLAGWVRRRDVPHAALRWLLAASVAVLMLVGVTAGLLRDALVDDVRRGEGFSGVDGPVLTFLAAHREGWLTGVMRAVTAIGSPVGVTLTVLAGVWVLQLRGRRRSDWVIAGLALGGAGLIETVIKDVVGRARPPIVLRAADVSADGFSFPSGHATVAAAGFGVLAALVVRRYGRWLIRVAGWTVAAGATVAVGFTRVYLGVHWLTDVLAAWLIGGAWLALLFTNLRLLSRPPCERGSPTARVAAPVAARARGGSQDRQPAISRRT